MRFQSLYEFLNKISLFTCYLLFLIYIDHIIRVHKKKRYQSHFRLLTDVSEEELSTVLMHFITELNFSILWNVYKNL